MIVLVAVVGVVCALPAAPIVPGVEAQAISGAQVLPTIRPTPVPTLSRTEVRDDFNQFALSYSTGNGIAVAQQGALKAVQSEDGQMENVLVQRGTFAYYGPDGQLYKVSYIADENGNGNARTKGQMICSISSTLWHVTRCLSKFGDCRCLRLNTA